MKKIVLFVAVLAAAFPLQSVNAQLLRERAGLAIESASLFAESNYRVISRRDSDGKIRWYIEGKDDEGNWKILRGPYYSEAEAEEAKKKLENGDRSTERTRTPLK